MMTIAGGDEEKVDLKKFQARERWLLFHPAPMISSL